MAKVKPDSELSIGQLALSTDISNSGLRIHISPIEQKGDYDLAISLGTGALLEHVKLMSKIESFAKNLVGSPLESHSFSNSGVKIRLPNREALDLVTEKLTETLDRAERLSKSNPPTSIESDESELTDLLKKDWYLEDSSALKRIEAADTKAYRLIVGAVKHPRDMNKLQHEENYKKAAKLVDILLEEAGIHSEINTKNSIALIEIRPEDKARFEQLHDEHKYGGRRNTGTGTVIIPDNIIHHEETRKPIPTRRFDPPK